MLIQVTNLVLAGVRTSSGPGVLPCGPRQAARLRDQPDPRQMDEEPPVQCWGWYQCLETPLSQICLVHPHEGRQEPGSPPDLQAGWLVKSLWNVREILPKICLNMFVCLLLLPACVTIFALIDNIFSTFDLYSVCSIGCYACSDLRCCCCVCVSERKSRLHSRGLYKSEFSPLSRTLYMSVLCQILRDAFCVFPKTLAPVLEISALYSVILKLCSLVVEIMRFNKKLCFNS